MMELPLSCAEDGACRWAERGLVMRLFDVMLQGSLCSKLDRLNKNALVCRKLNSEASGRSKNKCSHLSCTRKK